MQTAISRHQANGMAGTGAGRVDAYSDRLVLRGVSRGRPRQDDPAGRHGHQTVRRAPQPSPMVYFRRHHRQRRAGAVRRLADRPFRGAPDPGAVVSDRYPRQSGRRRRRIIRRGDGGSCGRGIRFHRIAGGGHGDDGAGDPRSATQYRHDAVGDVGSHRRRHRRGAEQHLDRGRLRTPVLGTRRRIDRGACAGSRLAAIAQGRLGARRSLACSKSIVIPERYGWARR